MWIEGDGPFTRRAVDYAERVAAGDEPACKQIKQACQRFLDDIDGDDWTFSPDRIEHVCAFGEMLPHTKAGWASRRELIRLEDWQVWVLASLFGFVGPDGFRKVREAFLLIPRKNGKSTLAAVIALYLAFMDGEAGAEVWIGANSMDQADACFIPAKKMAEQTPAFLEAYGITVAAKSVFTQDGSFVRSMIGKPGDGSNPHCAILDEAHENDSSDQYDTMKTGMGSREQPLLLTITTAGFNLAGPCRQRQLDAEAVLAGNVKNDALFAAIFTIDEGDDWKDFATWEKANPNLGVSVSAKYLEGQWQDALNKPSEKPSLLTKHLNLWQNSATGWLNQLDWIQCRSDVSLEDLKKKPCWIGMDLSTQLDIAAVVMAVWHEGKPHLFPYLFLPEGGLESSKNAGAYLEWIEAGYLIQTEGNALDFQVVKEQVLALAKDFDVRGLAYDQWQGQQLAQELQNEGIPVFKFVQNLANFNPVMKHFEGLVADHKICHSNNPCLNWMAANISVKPNNRDLLFPHKPDGQIHLKIDGMVAALMAIGLQMSEPEPLPDLDIFFI